MTSMTCEHVAPVDDDGYPDLHLALDGHQYARCTRCDEQIVGAEMMDAMVRAAAGHEYEPIARFRRDHGCSAIVSDTLIGALIEMGRFIAPSFRSEFDGYVETVIDDVEKYVR